MFTLIGLGVSVAYLYSLIGVLFPDLFPTAMRTAEGTVGVYFEAAGVIVVLILLGQVLELWARSRTGAAIKALLGLAPKTDRKLDVDADNKVTAEAVARKLNLDEVVAEVLPDQKAEAVKKFQQGGHVVAMSLSSVSVVGNALRLRRVKI